MTTKNVLWTLAVVGLIFAAVGTLAERRRHKRRDLDQVGWVPWTAVTIVGLTVAAASFGFALKVND